MNWIDTVANMGLWNYVTASSEERAAAGELTKNLNILKSEKEAGGNIPDKLAKLEAKTRTSSGFNDELKKILKETAKGQQASYEKQISSFKEVIKVREEQRMVQSAKSTISGNTRSGKDL